MEDTIADLSGRTTIDVGTGERSPGGDQDGGV